MNDTLVIRAPLSGWSLPLAEVPDAVFAQGMAGEGVALEPTSGTVIAPCDGVVITPAKAMHAVTLRHPSGAEVVVHVGIDTVALGGEGFERLAEPGASVRAGEPLLRFDLDAVARRAPSLVTPVVIASGGSIAKPVTGRLVNAGDVLFELRLPSTAAADAGAMGELRRELRIPFEHGLHMRPAAQVLAALRPYTADVELRCGSRTASARSAVAMMALGVHCGDTVEAVARGEDAAAALQALEKLLMPAQVESARAVPPALPPLEHGRVEALIASRGLAAGPAFIWRAQDLAVEEQGNGREEEELRLREAIEQVAEHLRSSASNAGADQRIVLEAHAELLRDPGLARRAAEEMRRGKSAAFAWREAARSTIASLASMADERMRERAADVRDLENQVLCALAGRPLSVARDVPEGAIVIAEELLPSQLAALVRDRAAGFCTARGGPTSHVAILAAAAGIPGLVGAGERVLAIGDGTALALDAEHGWLDVNPGPAEKAAFDRAGAQRASERSGDMAAALHPASTRDGVRIVVNANLGSAAEVAHALECGAEGCGLLRTEFLFFDRREAPGVDEQAREYQRIATALGARPLAIRTLDVGGDKPIAYLPLPREENPALGLRGLRVTLAQPELLGAQLSAILRVAPPGQCRVLLPMVTDVDEVQHARELLRAAAQEAGIAALPPLGAMIETPASALLAEALAAEADFLSIGTNDLAQYTLAIDRGHPRLAERLDALHPAVLELVARVARAAAARGKVASVCGALASDVDALPLLIGLGIREISATPAAIPRLKRTVRSLDAHECADLAARAVAQTSASAVRELAAMARSRARAASQTTFGGAA